MSSLTLNLQRWTATNFVHHVVHFRTHTLITVSNRMIWCSCAYVRLFLPTHVWKGQREDVWQMRQIKISMGALRHVVIINGSNPKKKKKIPFCVTNERRNETLTLTHSAFVRTLLRLKASKEWRGKKEASLRKTSWVSVSRFSAVHKVQSGKT